MAVRSRPAMNPLQAAFHVHAAQDCVPGKSWVQPAFRQGPKLVHSGWGAEVFWRQQQVGRAGTAGIHSRTWCCPGYSMSQGSRIVGANIERTAPDRDHSVLTLVAVCVAEALRRQQVAGQVQRVLLQGHGTAGRGCVAAGLCSMDCNQNRGGRLGRSASQNPDPH